MASSENTRNDALPRKALNSVETRECPRLVLHVDADAFFASVEQVLRPELRGLPVIVGGSDRGVVSAASYEARVFGVRSAMPVVQARRLCPDGTFLKPNFEAYRTFSREMFRIMRRYSPDVEATSVDEGYIELSGTLRLHRAPPWEVAHRILCEIRSTLGINCSGGMAGTKVSAKMATGLAKPNGLLYLEPILASKILGRLPVGAIPGVGKKARVKLARYGIKTVGDLASGRSDLLKSIMGRYGEKLLEVASGRDSRPVRTEARPPQKSYSKDRTLSEDTVDYTFLMAVAKRLAEKLAQKLRSDGKGAATVGLKVRYSDFTEASRSMTLTQPSDDNREILNCVRKLFPKTVTRRLPVRQVCVRLSNIHEPVTQSNLFDPTLTSRKARDRALDSIRDRFGFESVLVSGTRPTTHC